MSDDTQAQQQHWQQLKQQAISGEFRMEEGIGEALRKRCESLLGDLDRTKRKAQDLAYLAGYGGFPSAIDLQKKFETKANGGAAHDSNDSAVTRLQQNIDVVTLMRDTYAAAIGKLQESDAAAGARMNTQTEGVR